MAPGRLGMPYVWPTDRQSRFRTIAPTRHGTRTRLHAGIPPGALEVLLLFGLLAAGLGRAASCDVNRSQVHVDAIKLRSRLWVGRHWQRAASGAAPPPPLPPCRHRSSCGPPSLHCVGPGHPRLSLLRRGRAGAAAVPAAAAAGRAGAGRRRCRGGATAVGGSGGLEC